MINHAEIFQQLFASFSEPFHQLCEVGLVAEEDVASIDFIGSAVVECCLCIDFGASFGVVSGFAWVAGEAGVAQPFEFGAFTASRVHLLVLQKLRLKVASVSTTSQGNWLTKSLDED